VSCVARSLTNWPTLTARREGKAHLEATLPPAVAPLLEPLILHWWPLRRAAARERERRYLESS